VWNFIWDGLATCGIAEIVFPSREFKWFLVWLEENNRQTLSPEAPGIPEHNSGGPQFLEGPLLMSGPLGSGPVVESN